MGVQPAYVQRLRGRVKRQEFVKLRGEKTAAAHAGIELYVRLGSNPEPFRSLNKSIGFLRSADGEYNAQFKQLFCFPCIRDRLQE